MVDRTARPSNPGRGPSSPHEKGGLIKPPTCPRNQDRYTTAKIDVTMERAVVGKDRFLFGFVDVYLSYSTVHGTEECVVIEVKSSLTTRGDWSAVLRQVNT